MNWQHWYLGVLCFPIVMVLLVGLCVHCPWLRIYNEDDNLQALVDAVLTEAGIDKEHHKLIFELEVNSYGLFERCTSQTQACILLE